MLLIRLAIDGDVVAANDTVRDLGGIGTEDLVLLVGLSNGNHGFGALLFLLFVVPIFARTPETKKRALVFWRENSTQRIIYNDNGFGRKLLVFLLGSGCGYVQKCFTDG